MAALAPVERKTQQDAQTNENTGMFLVNLRNSAPARVSMEGPEILVPAMIVQPLALVVHELLINAVHGSLSAPSGRLHIHWQEVPGQGGFKLRWEETGGRTPASDRQPGFGTAMVGAMIEKQLLGKVEREWSDDGLVVDILVPIES